MSKLRKSKNNKLILVLPMVLVISFGVLLTYSFAKFKSIKLFDAIGGFFLGNEYTLSYDVANCTNKTIKNGKTFGELCEPALPDGYTFDGWYYNDELIESTTQVYTNTNIQLLAHFTQNNFCVIGKTYDFDYTGDVQQFTASCPGQYKVELWGAQGGVDSNNVFNNYGGFTSGIISLEKDESLFIYVGEAGNNTRSIIFNGGGKGGYGGTSNGASGGGATDVRVVSGEWNNFDSLKSRIMVAGGGGGAATSNYDAAGEKSTAGGLNGYSGGYYPGHTYVNQNGKGGTQIAGGAAGNNHYSATGTTYSGSFGIGGNSDNYSDVIGSGGGGGGYYGGGAGGGTQTRGSGQGGGGGSSFISGYTGCNAIANSSTSNSITHTNQSNHYSGYVFTNGIMIDGKGCNWETGSATNCGVNQPQPDGTKAAGHLGNGYARITYLGTTTDFAYTGSYQVYTVPRDGIYQVELWGAKGIDNDSANISFGAYTSGQINLVEGQSLYVYVGEVGSDTSSGFNGGGAGRLNDTLGYKWGGGATDVRYFGTTTPSDNDLVWNSNIGLNARIMVAAGGGGGKTGITSSSTSNGNAGGLTGYNGTYYSSYSSYIARGGSQTAGGTVTNYSSSYSAGTAGSFGQGGTGGGGNTASNGIQTGSYGGGGGYYGGGGGSRWNAATTGGAGGSSYISGHAGSIAIAEGDTNNPRTIKSGCSSSSTSVDCSKHYSGLYFTNTVMIDGSGYNWTTTKGSLVNQPQPDGTTTTGHNGNGYARITYIGKSYTVNYDSGNIVYDIPVNASKTTYQEGYYTASNSVISVTASRDDGYVMTPIKTHLKAGTTYILNIDTNGNIAHDTNDTVEAYLCLNGDYASFIRFDSSFSGVEFAVPTTGMYQLRLDVNKNGKTHTFQNFKVAEKLDPTKVLENSAIGTLPVLTNNQFSFGGWYLDSNYSTSVSDNYIVRNNITLYGKWTRNN